jgi:hypothetical protein
MQRQTLEVGDHQLTVGFYAGSEEEEEVVVGVSAAAAQSAVPAQPAPARDMGLAERAYSAGCPWQPSAPTKNGESPRVQRRWGHSQQPPPTARTQPPPAGAGVPGSSYDNLRAGAVEPGAFQPSVPVLMSAADLDLHTAQCQGLQKEARASLEAAIAELTVDRELASIDLTSGGKWPRWKEYIANHKCKERLVASGITAVTAERVAAGDGNRGGNPRVDIILHHASGGCCRIHPGSKASNDAKPRYQDSKFPAHTGWGAPK